MAITATIGGSNDVRVTKVYVPSETLGLSNLPDVDSSTKTDGAAVIGIVLVVSIHLQEL